MTKLITPKEFIQMPLSEAVWQVRFDLMTLVEEKDIVPYMDVWIMFDTREKICSVCLAGAALVSFENIRSANYPGYEQAGISLDEWHRILATFNQVRKAAYTTAFTAWYGYEKWETIKRKNMNWICDTRLKKHVSFQGNVYLDRQKLYDQLAEFSQVLADYGF